MKKSTDHWLGELNGSAELSVAVWRVSTYFVLTVGQAAAYARESHCGDAYPGA